MENENRNEETESIKCEWCGEEFDESELQKDVDLGYLCDRCMRGIASRGEKLILEY